MRKFKDVIQGETFKKNDYNIVKENKDIELVLFRVQSRGIYLQHSFYCLKFKDTKQHINSKIAALREYNKILKQELKNVF